MKRALPLVLLLGACAPDGRGSIADAGCESSTDRCACGCDAPWPVFQVEGDLTLHPLDVTTDPGCPALTPRDPLVLTVVDGSPKTLTAQQPTVVRTSAISDGDTTATVTANLSDVWVTTPVTLDYQLSLDHNGEILGQATGTFDGPSGPCALSVSVSGSFSPF